MEWSRLERIFDLSPRSCQHSGFQHRALLQSKLLEPVVVVPSLFTHVGAFSFLFQLFLFLFALLSNFLSAFIQQLLPLPLRVS